MSSILRTGKFIRCFASAARTILNTPKGYDNNLLLSTRSLTSSYSLPWSRGMATQQAESLDPLLQRLDAEVRRCGRLSRKDLDEMMEEIRHRHSVTSSQSLLIIRCCGNLVPEELPEERTRLVEQIWATLVERQVPMDISHYNALLRVYIENEHKFSPEKFLKELEERGLEPNRVTYQRLMWRYCQQGDVEGASRVLERMRAQELPLSAAVLDALVLGHSRLGDAEGARCVLGVMAGAGLQPSSRTYALLLGGSAARGDTEAIKQTLQECKEKDIYLSDKDLMDVIEECANGGHEEQIDFFLGEMQRSVGYNQDAISLILRLVTAKHEQAALKVYRTLQQSTGSMGDSANSFQGAFFIRHLVRSCSPETVLSICRQVQKENLSPRALLLAAEMALSTGKHDLATAIFHSLQEEEGTPLRQHFFWPMFIAAAKTKDNSKIMNLLKMMFTDFQIGVSNETLRDYVIPNLAISNPNKIMDLLRESGVSVAMAGKNIVHDLLTKMHLKSAAEFASTYGTKINLNSTSRALLDALASKKDLESFITILHLAITDIGNKKSSQLVNEDGEPVDIESHADPLQEQRNLTGRIVNRAIQAHPVQLIPMLPALLEALYSKGLGISAVWAERIQERLGDKLTPETSKALADLTSEDLVLLSLDSPNIPFIRRTPQQLEKIIAETTEKGQNNLSLKKQLILAYVREKQADQLAEYLQRLSAENYILTAGTLASLIEFYAAEHNIPMFEQYIDQLTSQYSDFNMDGVKVLRVMIAYASKGQLDKGIDFLNKNYSKSDKWTRTFTYNSLCWQLLNFLASEKNPEKVNEVFNLFVEKEMMDVNNSILGPLIKVHLELGDTEKALNEFERCCQSYRCTPWKGELTRRLIAAEDAAGLQRLTDLSTAIHGEVNSLYDLVFGFVECGRLRQARRILETPGMRTRNQRFTTACERYGQEGKVEYLEGLLEATKELSHIDRSEVFQQLLVTYTREGNADKALGLWTLLQEESVPPTDKFLIHLAQFLRDNNINVPFIIPSVAELPIETLKVQQKTTEKNNVKTSLQRSQPPKIPKEHTPKKYTLLETLVKENKLDEATDVFIKSAKEGKSLEGGRFLLNVLANSGNVDAFEKLNTILTEEQKKTVLFDNRRCNAYVNSGSAGVLELLGQLIQSVGEASTEEQLAHLRVSFPKGGIFGILEDPTVIPKYLEVSEKYAEKGILLPYNMLWIHYLIAGEDIKATHIWDNHLHKAEQILFRKLTDAANEQKSTELVDKLLGYLKKSDNISHNALGHAYSNRIKILVANGKVTEAVSTLENLLSTGLQLENLNRRDLLKLKEAVEQKGGEFPYPIPVSEQQAEASA